MLSQTILFYRKLKPKCMLKEQSTLQCRAVVQRCSVFLKTSQSEALRIPIAFWKRYINSRNNFRLSSTSSFSTSYFFKIRLTEIFPFSVSITSRNIPADCSEISIWKVAVYIISVKICFPVMSVIL